MCGIFAIMNAVDQNAAEKILTGLKTLEYRGYDSWGISVINSHGKIETQKKVGKIGQAVTNLPQSRIGIGHTRWATHGGVTEKNAHPHLDCSGNLSLVHNGIVENYQELKTALEKKGHHFLSETDTEVISHLIEQEMKTDSFQHSVMNAFRQLKGSNAILIFDANSQTTIAVKNSSPLLVGKNADSTFFSSDATAFIPHTNQVYVMEDGDLIVAQDKKIERFSIETGKPLTLEFKKMDLNSRSIDIGSFPNYFLKEIHDQPQVTEHLAKTDFANHIEMLKAIKNASQVVLVGCGSAYHCAIFGTYFLNKSKILALAYQAHEFTVFAQNLKPNSVVIAISQSGETLDTLLACQAAKKAGAKLVGIINTRGSSLERLVDFAFPVGAGPEIAVVSTKAFIAQVCSLALISEKLLDESEAGASKTLLNLAKATQSLLKNAVIQKQIKAVAKKLVSKEHLFVIGKGFNYPAALEFALKIKETTYLHTEGFAAGELKHGVISLIDSGTPAIVLTNDDDVMTDTFSNAIEIKSRGGNIFSCSPAIFDQADDQINLPNLGDLNSVLNIIVSQLLASELAVLKKLDPDKPRNLAKSVTVK